MEKKLEKVDYKSYYDPQHMAVKIRDLEKTEKKYKKLKIAANVILGVGIVVCAGYVGMRFGEIKMDTMICQGAKHCKRGIEKTFKDGSKVICRYFTKEQLETLAKKTAEEVGKNA